MCEILNIENLKTFEDRYNYDVSKYIEEKKIIGKRKDGTEYSFTLSYLSWAYAQKIAKIFDPNFKWFPVKTETGSLVHDGMVLIEMTFLGVTEQHYYPILDAGNKAIKMPNAFDVNTAQMRGMTKLFSMMSGLGLRLYTGEDLNLLELNGENNEENAIPPKQTEKKFNRDEVIAWLDKKYNECDPDTKTYLKEKLKYFKKSAFSFCRKDELEEIIMELKERKEIKEPDVKTMLKYIEDNEEKHQNLIDDTLERTGEPFIKTLDDEEIKALYKLIKGTEN